MNREKGWNAYTNVLLAALAGSEDDIREALSALNESELSRLRNAMRNVADLSESRRKQLWNERH